MKWLKDNMEVVLLIALPLGAALGGFASYIVA